MEDKEAIKILEHMLKADSTSAEEKEALKTAIGILGWSKLMEGYMDRRKKARDRRNSVD